VSISVFFSSISTISIIIELVRQRQQLLFFLNAEVRLNKNADPLQKENSSSANSLLRFFFFSLLSFLVCGA
jgi:hypothetical protein